jgi:transcriptional regulator with XRE-family HTH domain
MAKETNTETIQDVIGTFIYTERKKQKLSMATLSIKAYGTNAYASKIGKIEKGLMRNSSINTIALILAGLGYDMRDLFKK